MCNKVSYWRNLASCWSCGRMSVQWIWIYRSIKDQFSSTGKHCLKSSGFQFLCKKLKFRTGLHTGLCLLAFNSCRKIKQREIIDSFLVKWEILSNRAPILWHFLFCCLPCHLVLWKHSTNCFVTEDRRKEHSQWVLALFIILCPFTCRTEVHIAPCYFRLQASEKMSHLCRFMLRFRCADMQTRTGDESKPNLVENSSHPDCLATSILWRHFLDPNACAAWLPSLSQQALWDWCLPCTTANQGAGSPEKRRNKKQKRKSCRSCVCCPWPIRASPCTHRQPITLRLPL